MNKSLTNLYSSLSKKGVNKTLPLTKKEVEILQSITNLQEKEAQAIKELILCHIMKENENLTKKNSVTSDLEKNNELLSPPYGGEQSPYGTEFTISVLPVELSRIII